MPERVLGDPGHVGLEARLERQLRIRHPAAGELSPGFRDDSGDDVWPPPGEVAVQVVTGHVGLRGGLFERETAESLLCDHRHRQFDQPTREWWPTLDDIDFLFHSRAAGKEPDSELTEEHWRYMDHFADRMIARGPTLAADRATWTGSLHIVALASADAAREFVEREPYNRAGLFHDHVIRRFENVLGRTMWEFPAESIDPRFVVILHPRRDAGNHAPSAPPAGFTDLPRERLIVHGKLFSADDGAPAGVVLALQAPTREDVEALVIGGLAGVDGFDVEIHDWEFGGRR